MILFIDNQLIVKNLNPSEKGFNPAIYGNI